MTCRPHSIWCDMVQICVNAQRCNQREDALMEPQDDSYLHDRAEAELKRAQQAEHPAAVKAHYMLAGYYLDRLYGGPDETPMAPD
jgi:hypothetical protein